MYFNFFLSVFLMVIGTIGMSAAALATDKKGFGLVESQGEGAEALAALKVHWYYNWGVHSNIKTSVAFVPMAFSIRRVKDVETGSKWVLGFNEPDNAKQSNIAVEDALLSWPELVRKSQYTGSPAIAKNALNPKNWLELFMNEKPKVDFIAVHWYKGVDPKKFIADIQAVCVAYKKPVWITEFAPQTASEARAQPLRYSQSEVDAFIQATTQWMEQSECVQRYAWHDAKTGTSALFKDGKLTQSGFAYSQDQIVH
jgi:hypothetical protein